MTKNNSLVLTIDNLTGFAYNVSSDNFLFLSSQDSLNVFENVFAQVRQYLRRFATEPDFLSKMQTVFGDNFTRNSALGLSTAWAKDDFVSLPQIEIRSSQEINGALGAFSKETNRIYLAQEFISKNQSHPEIIAQVLLEEIGHWVDSRINVTDTPGDEGKFFTALVQGQTLSSEKIQQLKTTDDTTTVTIDGQVVEIEQAQISGDGGQGGTSEKIALESQGLNLVNFSWENYSIPDEFQILYEGKRIAGNVGLQSGGGSGKRLVAKKSSNDLDVKVTAPLEGTAWTFNVETLPLEIKIDGLLGDVIEIDIIKEFNKLGVSAQDLQDAGLNLNGFGLKNNSNDKGKVAEIDNFQDELKKGKFYFVPTTTGTPLVFGQTRNDAGIGESSLTLTNGTVEIPIKLKIQDGYEEKVTFGTKKLDLYRQEQRLSYLGFPQNSGNPLNINGKNDGNELSWATQLFNITLDQGTLSNRGRIPGQSKTLKANINSGNAPRWTSLDNIQNLTFVDTQRRFGTNGSATSITNAINTLGAKLNSTGVAGRNGAGNPSVTHDGGRGIDIDIPGREIPNNSIPHGSLFFRERRKNDKVFVAAPDSQIIIKDGDVYRAGNPFDGNDVARGLTTEALIDNAETILPLIAHLLVDNDNIGYSLQNAINIINAFKGQGIQSILFNDPRTWASGATFSKGHWGHIHFEVAAPAQTNPFQIQTSFQVIPFSTPTSGEDFANTVTLSSSSSLGSAIDLGTLEGNQNLTGQINSINPDQYYRFVLGTPVNESEIEGDYFLTLRSFSALMNGLSDDADLELIRDYNEDGVRQDEEVIASSEEIGNSQEFINITNLPEDVYYIRIFQKSGDTNYNLSLTAPPLPVPADNAGNTPTNAQDLGTLNGSLTRTDFIGEVDKDDYYRFNLTSVSDLSLEVNGLDQGDLTVTLGKDINNDGVIDFDETIAISDAEGNEPEAININGLADGTYYVWLSRNSGNTDYNLNLSATPSVIPPDQAGSTPSTAFDIGSLSVASNFNDFVGNVDPEDFYRFTLANVSGLKIELDGLSSDADLELAQDVNNDGVIDSDEVISTSNLEGNDAEVIDISALAAGNYFVRVHQYEGDTNYNLSLTPTNAIGSDLLVTRTDSTGAVNLGDQYTYALTVTNNGPSTATNIVLTENLPSGVNFVSATTTPVSVNNGVVTASLGTLNSGETATVNLTLGTFASGNLLSTTNVTSSEYDYNPSNNSLVSTKTVNSITSPNADLQLTQIVNNLNPGIGNQITFTLTLKNQGPGTATVIKVQDILPGGLSFVSAYADLGSYDSNTGIWTVGNMPPNASVNLSISANVNSGQSITNTAEVIAVDEGDPDSVPNNNNPNEDDQASVTIVIGNQAPTNLALSKTNIDENQPIGSMVGDFTTTDPDTGNTFSYSLVTGTGSTDNSLFTIVGNQLKANAQFDFESKNSYSVRVKTTDQGGLSYEKPFTIAVTNVNEAPTDILLTKQPASGNLPIGTILGNFSSTDPDTGNTFTYSLVNGLGNTSNSLFTIVGNKLKTNIPLDTAKGFEFSIRVRTTDQGDLFFDKNIEIKTLSGGGWGDVHLRTFDGLWYDQQSFGDFILVKSTVDDWQIQTRQNPWIYNSSVSVNTAFATTVDGHRVLFDKFLDDGKKLKIDGNQVTLTSGESLTIGNSKISRQGNSYTLIYAGQDGILSTGDDDQLIASDNESYVDINVLPSNGRAGLLQGFLGNADGIISNEFTLRSGTLLSSNPTWEQIHGVWAESWRVLESESLFTTPPPFQGTPSKITLSDLSPKDVQDAKDIGIKLGLPDAALNAAALDYALTKDIAFLNNAANLFSPKFSISSSSIAEGDKDSSSVRLFVKLSTSSKRTVTVDYATQDGTGLNKAIAGSDYTATSGTLTFLPGTTVLTVDIPILGDTNIESDESFLVNLTNPYGAILATSQSTINILNDDLTLVPTFAGTSSNDVFTGGDGNDIINGEGGDDSLNGGAGDDTLNGGPGKDVLTGGSGKDVFVYNNFTDSLFANPDRIRSFNPSEGDRIDLANIPTATFNAGNISALNLTAAVIAAYADADPTVVGAQALAVNQAVFFSFGATASTRRTYLAVNDSSPDYNSGNDLFIEVTGIVGTLPSGSLASQSYFI